MVKFNNIRQIWAVLVCFLPIFAINAQNLNKNETFSDDFDSQHIPHYIDTSADTFELDLNTAIELGIKNNLDIKNKKLDLNSNTLDVATSWNKLLSSTVDVKYDNKIVKNNNATGEAGNVSLSMNNGLSISGDKIYAIINSVRSYKQGKMSYQNAKLSLTKEIKQLYFNIAIAKQKIWLKQIELDNAMGTYQKSKMKFKDGMVSQVDLLKTEYDVIKILPNLDSLYNNYINSESSFKQIIGLECDKQIHYKTQIPTDISHLEVDASLRKKLDSNYTITSYILKLQDAVNSRNQSIVSATVPSFNISHNLNIIEANNVTSSNSVDLSVSFKISTPLPFSAEQVSIAKNVFNVKKATNDLQKIKETQVIEMNKLINEIQLAEKNIRSYNLNVDISEKTFDMVGKQYDFGVMSFLEYQDAKKNVYDAKLQLIEEQWTYISKIFDLEYMLETKLIDLQ